MRTVRVDALSLVPLLALFFPRPCISFVPTLPVSVFRTSATDTFASSKRRAIEDEEDDDDYDDSNTRFDRMRSLEKRLERIERTAPSCLEKFYEPHLLSFSVRPGNTARLSITSTCFALRTVHASDRSVYESVVNYDAPCQPRGADKNDRRVPVRSVVEALLLAEWREEDLFQVPLLLRTILEVDEERVLLSEDRLRRDERAAHRVCTLVDRVLSARPQRRLGQTQNYSDYILYLVTEALAALQRATPPSPVVGNSAEEDHDDDDDDTTTHNNDVGVGGLPSIALPPNAAARLGVALARSAETSFNELCRQLAYRAADDRTAFDPVRLAYSLLTYVSSSSALAGTAGREETPGTTGEPAAGSATPPVNPKLVRTALAAFFAEQRPDGTWDKGQPIYKSFRRTGRNVGNAFVFDLDTLGSLLSHLPPTPYFRPHLAALERSLRWIETHRTVEIVSDQCDPVSGECRGRPLAGWGSPHLGQGSSGDQDGGPSAWSTAQTLACVGGMRRALRRIMCEDVLNEFGGRRFDGDLVEGITDGSTNSGGGSNPAGWDRLLDSDLGAGDDARTLKDVLQTRVLEPFGNGDVPGYGAAYSTILFGPPGTAKTTICEAVAEYMGWDFLVIDTSAFLADGLTNVAARIRHVFERLIALERCVILFDEIEEFCLDRESPHLGMESRMLTTAMLTAINDLRRAKRCVFFLATNRLRAFDSAITRPGRFDMQLFVGTPNLESKCAQFRSVLATRTTKTDDDDDDDDHEPSVVSTYRAFLQDTWTEETMFMNYLEGAQFASACADVVASGAELDHDTMSSILTAQAAVMTTRGSAREEFVETMELSRL